MRSVRPPEYFPRLSYLAQIARSSVFILADTFQYSRQSHQNRMRVRMPQGAHWLSVPLEGGQHGLPICDVAVEQRHAWARTHWRTLTYNYGSSPYFEHYGQEVRDLLHRDWTRLGDLTCASVEYLHRALRLPGRLVRASTMAPPPETLLDFSRTAAEGFLVAAETAAHDTTHLAPAAILTYEEQPRRQNFPGFEPGLSALDLLFNYGPRSAEILERGSAVMPEVDGKSPPGQEGI